MLWWWWWWWWLWIAFAVWLTNKRRLSLFPAGTIVRYPHHCESPIRREKDLSLRRTELKLCWSTVHHYTMVLLMVLMKHVVLLVHALGGGLHKLNHFSSRISTLHFTWNCKLVEAKNLPRKLGHFKWFTRETRYHLYIAELAIRNLKSQVVELVQRPKNHAENTLFL